MTKRKLTKLQLYTRYLIRYTEYHALKLLMETLVTHGVVPNMPLYVEIKNIDDFKNLYFVYTCSVSDTFMQSHLMAHSIVQEDTTLKDLAYEFGLSPSFITQYWFYDYPPVFEDEANRVINLFVEEC